MTEPQTVASSEPVEFDHLKLLGFRDLTSLGDDLGLIADELDAAHVKIGVEEGSPPALSAG